MECQEIQRRATSLLRLKYHHVFEVSAGWREVRTSPRKSRKNNVNGDLSEKNEKAHNYNHSKRY